MSNVQPLFWPLLHLHNDGVTTIIKKLNNLNKKYELDKKLEGSESFGS